MTTTPTASPELPDLDKLEALARAATPGEWKAMPHGRVVGGPLRHYVNGSAKAQIASFGVTFHEQAPEDEPERQQANADFAAAANPEQVLALIALARRAQPEGEAPQAVAVSALKEIATIHGSMAALIASEALSKMEYLAATLSPLCGAQHAESGKKAYQVFSHDSGEWYGVDKAQYDRAHDSCRRVLAAQQAAAPGARAGEAMSLALSALEVATTPLPKDRQTVLTAQVALRAALSSTSAPGTPEAPQTAAARDVLAERQRQVKAEGYDHENDDNYVNDEMAAAAAFYVMPPGVREWPMDGTGYGATMGQAIYPDWMPPKIGDRRRDLVKGAALALAEIERLDRAAAPKGGA